MTMRVEYLILLPSGIYMDDEKGIWYTFTQQKYFGFLYLHIYASFELLEIEKWSTINREA